MFWTTNVFMTASLFLLRVAVVGPIKIKLDKNKNIHAGDRRNHILWFISTLWHFHTPDLPDCLKIWYLDRPPTLSLLKRFCTVLLYVSLSSISTHKAMDVAYNGHT